MPTEIRIRALTLGDCAAAELIITACWRKIAEPDCISRDELQRMERYVAEHFATSMQSFSWFGAELNGALAGVAAISVGSLEELWVDPDAHRQGIGTRLFKCAVERLKARGNNRMKVTTTGFDLAFYESMGMAVAGSQIVTCGPLAGRKLIVLEREL